MISYSIKLDSTKALGPPDNSALWVDGCDKNCAGCIYKAAHMGKVIKQTPEELAKFFINAGAPGIVISGGEPFLQAQQLYEMLVKIKERIDRYGVIVYSGNTYNELVEKAKADEGVKNLLSVTDVLIDGAYVDELNDDKRRFVGSSNQNVVKLSSFYSQEYLDEIYCYGERIVEFNVFFDTAIVTGVPTREQYKEIIEQTQEA